MVRQDPHLSIQSFAGVLSTAGDAERTASLAFSTPILEKLTQQILDRNEYIFHPPIIFLGALSHIYAGCTIEHSRALTAKGLDELDATIAAGNLHRVDRVTVYSIRFAMPHQPIDWKRLV